jgi:serine/threonine protein kinase
MDQPKNLKDNYIKIKTLGRGAFGDVSLVENKTTKEKFAMKIIEKKLLMRVILIKISF